MKAINSTSTRTLSLIIVVISALAFIPFLGGVNLFDWDEINFAECAREMIVDGNYIDVQIAFRPFWEKPPLFVWMQVVTMKMFGVNEFAARLPNAIAGIVTLLTIFFMGKKLHSKAFGLLWSFVYFASVLSHFYFRSGIIDPWFNFFMFVSIYFFFQLQISETKKKRNLSALLSGVFVGLSVLTKGPVGLLIVGAVVFIFLLIQVIKPQKFVIAKDSEAETKPLKLLSLTEWLIFLSSIIIVGSIWFILQIIGGNLQTVIDFIAYQVRLFLTPDAGHDGNFLYHVVVLLIGMFPISIFSLKYLFRIKDKQSVADIFAVLMQILFWFVLILFTIVKTKIVHYSSLCYFPMSFLGAYCLMHIFEGKVKWSKLTNVLLIIIAAVFSLVVAVVPLVEKYKQELIPYIKDDFAVLNLQAEVNWLGWEWVIALIFFIAVIVAVAMSKKNKYKKAFITLFSASAIFIISVIYIFPYRIEKYTQGAVIEFYKSVADEDCYVLTSGFHTYASHFYTKSTPFDYKPALQLLTKNPDKPVYLVLKEPHYNQYKHLVVAMEVHLKKNGWVVLKLAP